MVRGRARAGNRAAAVYGNSRGDRAGGGAFAARRGGDCAVGRVGEFRADCCLAELFAAGISGAVAGKKGRRGVLMIAGGRHPVIEKLLEERGERFVPNDLYLCDPSPFILIITGPNMGGKSTYLRQTALVSIL